MAADFSKITQELKDLIYSLPESKDKAHLRISGRGLVGRRIEDESIVDRIAEMLTVITRYDKQTSLSYTIHPRSTDRYGLFIDIDLKMHYPQSLASPLDVANKLNVGMIEVAAEFVRRYVKRMLEFHFEKNPIPQDEQISFEFKAFYGGRPEMSGPHPGDGGSVFYKYGCHIYIGQIRASYIAQTTAYEEVRAKFSGDSRSHATNIIREEFRVSDPASIFDRQVSQSGNMLLPGCRKATGTITYEGTKVILFKVVATPKDIVFPETRYEDFSRDRDHSHLAIFFPVGKGHSKNPIFVIDTKLDSSVVDIPQDIPLDEEVMFIEEAKERCQSAAKFAELINIIPDSVFTDEAEGHMNRMKIINDLYHAIQPISVSKEWTKRIIERRYNRIVGTFAWKDQAHIVERLEDAITFGPKAKGAIIGFAKDADSLMVSKIERGYSNCTVRNYLLDLWRISQQLGRSRRSTINHIDAATLLIKIIGRNYAARSSTGIREWYHYSDITSPGPGCAKWAKINNLQSMLSRDIRDVIQPMLRAIADQEEHVVDTTIQRVIPFPMFVRRISDDLGESGYQAGVEKMFDAAYDDTGRVPDPDSPPSRFPFGLHLDMRPDLTGCLNGILKFEAHPFRVTLMTGDNREYPVSRSLHAMYRTDFTDESPEVKKIMSIFGEIIPIKEELDFMMTIMAAVILSGHHFEKFYILYGSGGDGKSTLLNAFMALAGDGASPEIRGYGAEGDPRLFQREKQDANGHDGGSFHLYGGPRLGNFPEPNSERPWFVESAIKSALSGSASPKRDLGKSVQILRFNVTPFILLNNRFEIKGGITTGGLRRIMCLLFREKFKAASDMARYRGKKGFHQEDPEVLRYFTDGANSASYRSALLWILITHYLPKFYDDYDANINAVPVPKSFKDLTAAFIGSHSIVIDKFSDLHMEMDPESRIPLSEFFTSFTAWYRRTQSGTHQDFAQKLRGALPDDPSGPVVMKPWERTVLSMISSSALGSDICVSEEDGEIHPVGVNEFPLFTPTRLFISGWKWSDRAPAQQTESVTKSMMTILPPSS